MTTEQAQVQEAIQEMVRRIVRQFHPLQVILFGSHAKGLAGPESDVDLLVVLPVSGSRRQKSTEMDLALWGIDLPADIIVADPQEIEQSRDRVGHLLYEALKEGQVLYERACQPIGRTEAVEAVAAAKAVRDEVRANLPVF